jgi:N6-L-threonylcarbamoyladenine synthase
VLSSVIASQTHIHSHWGGVYPEFASRAHALVVVPTIERALKEANVEGPDLQAIGVTRGPGLIGSLIVGVNTAAGLGLGWNVPVLGINHLRGHLRSADLVERRVELPAIVLLVSGGHTFLARMESLTENCSARRETIPWARLTTRLRDCWDSDIRADRQSISLRRREGIRFRFRVRC